MGFFEVTQAGQTYSENVFGEAFTYSNVSLKGVFDQVVRTFTQEDFSQRLITLLRCETSKAQWASANIAPANRGVVTYGGITYEIDEIAGANTSQEPAYTLMLRKNT